MKKTKIVSSALVGNIVEYYDFGIYAVFTTIIGKLFFPTEDEFVQTISAFSVFAIGFMMRPIGGAFFGLIGDRFGRKTALTSSIIGIAIATFGIALLPTYEQIGILAPIILIIIRLFQGLCIGGEGAGAAVFILEHLGSYRPGLVGSIIMASNMIGTLFAILVGIIINHFFTDNAFSWRYGFILGGLMGLTGLYLRKHVAETPVFQAMKKNRKLDLPFVQVIKYRWRRLLVVSCLSGVATSVAYTIRAYLNVFFLQFMGYTPTESLFLTAICLFSFVIVLPIFGLLSDKVGYHKFVQISCIILIVCSLPVFKMLSSDNISIILLGLFIISMLAAAISAPAYPYAIENFSPILRYSGVAMSWNIGNALFGGTAPTIETYLAQYIGLEAPAFYLILIALLFLIMSYFTKSSKY
ncbi:MAG: MFS transporter [Candidatus Midichloria sp.]|nr:MFS transporter [Candidatus Midichloria sp.]